MLMPNSADVTGATDKRSDPPRVTTIPSQFDAARLSETQRSLVMLKDYEGYSYEEIGKIMNLNESQVKVYLHRARLQLKEYIVKVENVICTKRYEYNPSWEL